MSNRCAKLVTSSVFTSYAVAGPKRPTALRHVVPMLDMESVCKDMDKCLEWILEELALAGLAEFSVFPACPDEPFEYALAGTVFFEKLFRVPLNA